MTFTDALVHAFERPAYAALEGINGQRIGLEVPDLTDPDRFNLCMVGAAYNDVLARVDLNRDGHQEIADKLASVLTDPMKGPILATLVKPTPELCEALLRRLRMSRPTPAPATIYTLISETQTGPWQNGEITIASPSGAGLRLAIESYTADPNAADRLHGELLNFLCPKGTTL